MTPSKDSEINYREEISAFLQNKDASGLESALEVATLWTEKESDNPRAYLYQGDLYKRLRKTELAIQSYHVSAQIYAARGKVIQSIAAHKLILEMDPTNEAVRERLAQLAHLHQQRNQNPKEEIIELSGEDMISEETQKIKIPETPLFSALDSESLYGFVEKLEHRRLENGEFLCQKGDPGDSIYVISHGELVILDPQGSTKPLEIATLREGAFLGEFAFFTDKTRHASVQAKGPAEILEIKRNVIEELIQNFPQIQDVLNQFYRQRVLDTLLAQSKLFGILEARDRALVMEEFSSQQSPLKTTLLLEGDPGDTLYFIQNGEVEIFRERNGKKITFAKLSGGEFFGELAFLSDHRRKATVKTLTDCHFLTLNRQKLEKLTSQFPALLDQLKTIAQRRLAKLKPPLHMI